MSQAAVLLAVLTRVEAAKGAGKRPLVVLDLDDTLLATAKRHVRIMAEFAAARPAAAAVAAVRPEAVAYQIADTARAAGLTDPGLLAELKDFWFKRFFKNEYLCEDDEVPGAAAFCRRVVAAGGVPAYFTGRDETMREGTLKNLARHGFPMPGHDGAGLALLVLKPKFETPDLEFKEQGLSYLASLGSIEAGFENEPAHVNLFDDHFPHATHILVDTKHSGKPVVPKPHLPVIKDFRL